MYKLVLLIFVVSNLFLGCRTFSPPNDQDNPQPWAQPEKWEKTKGLPGFSSQGSDVDY